MSAEPEGRWVLHKGLRRFIPTDAVDYPAVLAYVAQLHQLDPKTVSQGRQPDRVETRRIAYEVCMLLGQPLAAVADSAGARHDTLRFALAGLTEAQIAEAELIANELRTAGGAAS